MAGRHCDKCGQDEHHAPNCPEMFWPDGHRRGTVHPESRARYSGRPVSEPPPFRPGKVTPPHYDSPLAEELRGIFSTVKVRVVRDT